MIVLEVLLRRHRDTEAARTFLARLLGEFDVLETISTDKCASYGAAVRAIRALEAVHRQQVISTARCSSLIEQWANVASGAAPPKTVPPSQMTTRAWPTRLQKMRQTQEFLNLHVQISGQASSSALLRPRHQPSSLYPNGGSRPHQNKQPTPAKPDVVQGWPELLATPAICLPAARFT